MPIVIPPGGVTINFQTTSSLAVGSYLLTLDGQAGSAAGNAGVTVTVQASSGTLQIQRLEPSRVMVGVPIAAITVAGNGFTGGSTVLFDGVSIPTFYHGTTALDAEIPITSLNTAQSHTVQVSDPTNGKSNVAIYEVYAPQPGPTLFTGQLTQYMSECPIVNPLVPDLNGDGRADLVLVTLPPGTSQYVPLLRFGQADGTFSASTSLGSFALSFSPTMVVAGDFNNDGHMDLILFGTQANSQAIYQVLLNNGAARFTKAGGGVLPSSATFLGPAIAGDFNRDGLMDFAFGDSGTGQALSLFLGNGDGTFANSTVGGRTGGTTYSLSAQDLNNDGYTDLVYLYILNNGGNELREFLSSADGSFTDVKLSGLPSPSVGLVVADFNHDFIPDIFAVDSSGQGQAYLGIGDGTFKASGNPIFACDLFFVAPPYVAGDFDNDGNVDVATRTQLSGPDEMLFLYGDGKGSFTSRTTVSDHSFTLQVGDVNGDGIDDIFAAGALGFAYPSTVLGRTDRNFPSAQFILAPNWGDLSTGDVFGDGFKDLLVAGAGNGGVGSVPGAIYHFQTDGTFAQQGQAPQYNSRLIDLNGDGIADMVGFNSTGLVIWKGDGSGVFQQPINQITLTYGGLPICFRDMDGDGNIDIVVSSAILYGTGNFQFTLVSIPFYQNFAVGDFDGDGIADIATPSGIMFGQGNRTFTAPTGITPLQNSSPPFPIQVVADMNSDGMDDFIFGPEIFLSVGRQGFVFDQELAINGYFAGVGSVVVSDFNGDGLPDIAAGVFNGGEDLLLFTNDGTGKYQITSYAVGVMSVFSVDADLTRDGTPDLAFRGYLLDYVPPTMTILLHK